MVHREAQLSHAVHHQAGTTHSNSSSDRALGHATLMWGRSASLENRGHNRSGGSNPTVGSISF
jgi:hypothetical protein